MDGWMDGWVDGWMDGKMYGWMDGWMYGWMDGRTECKTSVRMNERKVETNDIHSSLSRSNKNTFSATSVLKVVGWLFACYFW